MSRFQIDFARDTARVRAVSFMVLAAGCCAVATGAWSLASVAEERAAVRERSMALREGARPRVQGPTAEAPMPPERAREAVQANLVAGRLNLPWSGLLDAIENSARTSVVLLAMLPDPQDGSLRLTGEARSLPVILDYLQALQQQSVFAEVRLESHETMLQSPQRPVRFVAAAAWKRRP
jgi:hypothetical protein